MTSIGLKEMTPMKASSPAPLKIVSWPRRRNVVSAGLVNTHDFNGAKIALSNASEHLFKQDGTVQLIVCRASGKECFQVQGLMSYDELDTYMENKFQSDSLSSSSSTCLFLLDQLHSYSGLDITQDALSLLLDWIGAFPKLADALTSFADDEFPTHEGRSNFHALSTGQANNSNIFELCMLFKYVTKNGNKSDPVPWSIRQMLLYQSFDGERQRDAVLLARASETLKRRIQEEFLENPDASECLRHWANMPMLAVSSLSADWEEYTKYLDLAVWKLGKSSTHTNPFSERLGEVNFKDLKLSQTYTDLLLRASHALQNNILVLQALAEEARKRQSLETRPLLNHYQALDDMIESTTRELTFTINHISLIRARLDRITETIRDCINVRSSHHAALENSSIHGLTVQTIREARTVKTIALVTLVYLPASFVATFFSTGMLQVWTTGTRGLFRVSAKPDLWFYLALTIPLTLATLAAWWVWEWVSRRRKMENEEFKV
ncbi:hypothetical protein K432DRAFT_381468 [Lepidopterella palustris CBS 459.81]|uniref:CorA-like transporter domain-containing protein n=1 Tax=Lepidopterella palustris CBS 459.81 TaxID=1314670 RepID=A0A8E2EBZ9_9PEZI|nr:hypothetical protein K432DRAFT_381468 [Lepidopterella palustris CBS 459.81]